MLVESNWTASDRRRAYTMGVWIDRSARSKKRRDNVVSWTGSSFVVDVSVKFSDSRFSVWSKQRKVPKATSRKLRVGKPVLNQERCTWSAFEPVIRVLRWTFDSAQHASPSNCTEIPAFRMRSPWVFPWSNSSTFNRIKQIRLKSNIFSRWSASWLPSISSTMVCTRATSGASIGSRSETPVRINPIGRGAISVSTGEKQFLVLW